MVTSNSCLFICKLVWPVTFVFIFSVLTFVGWFWARNRESVAGLFQAITTVILVGVTMFYASETGRMATQNQRSDEITLRPYLVYRPNQLVINQHQTTHFSHSHYYTYYLNETVKQLIIPYQVKNVGRVPATNIVRGHRVYGVEKTSNEIKNPKNWPSGNNRPIDPDLGPEESSLSHQDHLWNYEDERIDLASEFIRLVLWVKYETIGSLDGNVFCTAQVLDLQGKDDAVYPQFSITYKVGHHGLGNECSNILEENRNLI